MTVTTAPQGLGILNEKNRAYLFYYLSGDPSSRLRLDVTHDGYFFKRFVEDSSVLDTNSRKETITTYSHVNAAEIESQFFLTYLKKVKKVDCLHIAVSTDLKRFRRFSRIDAIHEPGQLVSQSYLHNNQFVLYFGSNDLHVAYSPDLISWTIQSQTALKSSPSAKSLHTGLVRLTDQGILVVYFEQGNVDSPKHFSIHCALFDGRNPEKLFWRSSEPIWKQPEEWEQQKLTPVGMALVHDRLFSYWQTAEGVMVVTHTTLTSILETRSFLRHAVLRRVKENPLLSPIVNHFWESKAVFNPTAFYEAGKIHIIYRAIGDNDVSVLGYATSKDGIHIDNRLPFPIYVPSESFEGGNLKQAYSTKYMSGGGGYGGCEDPRIVKLGDRLYMTYVAYDGYSPPRVALTSISTHDFLTHNFDAWEKPVLISKPGIVNKNACILPETIDNKYVIFHRIFPDILIDYVDDLTFDGKHKWLVGHHKIKPRKHSWDSRKVGIGAPPVLTDLGWLIIYQAVGNHDAGKYKMGAMILDKNNPAQVLYRSTKPILEPDMWYENEGYKSGVVYPCGAVTKDDQLFVYYGGADTVVCAATAHLPHFLSELQYTGAAKLHAAQLSA